MLRFIFAPLVVLVLILASIWILLAAPMFSPLRRGTLETLLSEQIGQPIRINKDASVLLGSTSRIHASGVEIPSQNMPDVVLAELNLLDIDLNLIALMRGDIDLNNLIVDGLKVRLLRDADNTTSWNDAPAPAEVSQSDRAAPPSGLLVFLRERNFRFTNIGLDIVNDQTGFEFLFDLQKLELGRDDPAAPPALNGQGLLNEAPVSVSGQFPQNAPFQLTADIAGIAVDYSGQIETTGSTQTQRAELHVEIDSLGSLLDVLKLNHQGDGVGQFDASVVLTDDVLRLEDVRAAVDVQDGAHIEVAGDIDDLLSAHGVAMTIFARLYPEDQPPPQAHEFKDLVLTEISAKVAGNAEAFRFEDLRFATNAFEPELESLGPVAIRDIVRTPEGQLSMKGIEVHIGPPETPYIVAEGQITDLLELKDIDLSGRLDLPARLALPPTLSNPDLFGRMVADFAATDSTGHLSLTQFNAKSQGTDLWSAEIAINVGDITKLSDVDFSASFALPKVEEVIDAFGVEPSAEGQLDLHASLRGDGRDFKTAMGLTTNASDLTTEWRTRFDHGVPRLDGRIFSTHIDLDDVADATPAAIDLAGAFRESAPPADAPSPTSKEDATTGDAAGSDPDPLDSGDAPSKPKQADKGLQPLVLPEPETTQAKPEPDRPDLQPLVIDATETPGDTAGATPELDDLLNLPRLMAVSEVEFAIDIAEISGQEGITSIDSALMVSGGAASLGPLDLSYGGGHVSVSAGIDLIETPELVSISGNTGGWDFGKILDAVGAGIPAYGILTGKFDVTGDHASLDDFASTMTGTAHISLSGGKIGTSLLELAGLGVLPWLFSKEAAQGFTKIVCMEAPLSITSGRFSSSSIVAETESVQVVVKGHVDLKSERINLRAEPRPVGKAHARSAWPVEITGALSKPKIDVKPGSAPATGPIGGGLFAPKPKAAAKRVPCRPDARQTK